MRVTVKNTVKNFCCNRHRALRRHAIVSLALRTMDVFGAAALGTLINIGVATTEDPQLTYGGIGVVGRDPVDAATDGAGRVSRRLLDSANRQAAAAERAGAILRARRTDLDRGAELPLARETLSPEDFAPLKKQVGRPRAA